MLITTNKKNPAFIFIIFYLFVKKSNKLIRNSNDFSY